MVKVRKGFTLVELLIVIVIIGILAAAMLLSSTSATASAEASSIVSELRGLKAAASMFYADSMDVITAASTLSKTGHAAITGYLAKYMDNPNKVRENTAFTFHSDSAQGKWYVGYQLNKVSPQVKEKLAGRAKTTGLYSSHADTTSTNAYAGSTNEVWMVAR